MKSLNKLDILEKLHITLIVLYVTTGYLEVLSLAILNLFIRIYLMPMCSIGVYKNGCLSMDEECEVLLFKKHIELIYISIVFMSYIFGLATLSYVLIGVLLIIKVLEFKLKTSFTSTLYKNVEKRGITIISL